MGVLAVAQRADLRPAGAGPRGEAVTIGGVCQHRTHPAGHRDVIGRGMSECLCRQPLPGFQRRAAGGQRVGDQPVLGGRGDHRNARMVLRGGPHHRGTTDVDLFDAIVGGGARGDRLGERVEIDHDQVERRNPELVELLAVRGETTICQEAGMNPRMQRLDASVEALGETGQFLHRGHRHAGIRQLRRCRTGGDDLDAVVSQLLSQLDQPRLVVNRDQGPTNRLQLSHASPSPVRKLRGRAVRAQPP
ncbi:hypothetical protein SDC9_133702 [bioreactor metagenome]|uniref:Uncharacterized protein n=1 Tax=bioreactor metagenome TaxID=1076179 RepID=A0A645DDG8_9ZZZZ